MPALTLQLRRAGVRDLPQVARLLAELGTEKPLTPARARALFARIRRHPGYHIYLAYAEGELVGTFSLFVIPTLMHDGAAEALVDGVVVDPAHRGRGIGREMMRAAMALAARAGCYKLALSSNLRREDAHRFYRELGFAQHGISFSVPLKRAAQGGPRARSARAA